MSCMNLLLLKRGWDDSRDKKLYGYFKRWLF
jgi:hypothetical protein